MTVEKVIATFEKSSRRLGSLRDSQEVIAKFESFGCVGQGGRAGLGGSRILQGDSES